MKIGVMGARGSFSEMAGEQYIAKQKAEKATIVPLISAERVLSALNEGMIDVGIFPIENSNGGIVLEAVYAMAAHRFHIQTMFEVDIHHNLLVRQGVTRDTITTITSHDQALKQCRHYLKRAWRDADLTEYNDTAQAAEDLAKGILDEHTAVIAPLRSAEIYGLAVLEESIQDLKFNYTIFITATRLGGEEGSA